MRGIWSVRLLRGLEISCALCRLGKNRSGEEGKGGVICHDTGSFFFFILFFFTLEFDVVAIVVCLFCLVCLLPGYYWQLLLLLLLLPLLCYTMLILSVCLSDIMYTHRCLCKLPTLLTPTYLPTHPPVTTKSQSINSSTLVVAVTKSLFMIPANPPTILTIPYPLAHLTISKRIIHTRPPSPNTSIPPTLHNQSLTINQQPANRPNPTNPTNHVNNFPPTTPQHPSKTHTVRVHT